MTTKILATGTDFIQSGRFALPVLGTASTIEKIMENPHTLRILAYSVSSYADNFLELLKEAIENRTGNAQMDSKTSGTCNLCGKSWNVAETIFFQQANQKTNAPFLRCKDKNCFKSNRGNMSPKKILHAKVIVVDEYRDTAKAIVGSANFSWGGLANHYEVGTYVEGEQAKTLGQMILSVADCDKN
jgi:phosphatidylserine/phosphatidylglycerophosphate/cardiolipin synthase-like enzyme